MRLAASADPHLGDKHGKRPLIDAAAGTPDLSTLVAAIKAAGLENAFDDTSAKVTVFAPTDDAFNAALSALGLTAEELLASPLLGDILKYHIVGEPYTADMLVDGISLPTLEGSSLMGYDGTTIVAANGNATIVDSDVYTCQGIVQVIDAVMLPQSAIDALSGGGRRSLLQFEAVDNATAEEMPALSMPAVGNATAEEMLEWRVSQLKDELRRARLNSPADRSNRDAPMPLEKKELVDAVLLARGGESGQTCNVCFDDFESGDGLRVLPCGHRFHVECVDKWLRSQSLRCPLCNHDATKLFRQGLRA